VPVPAREIWLLTLVAVAALAACGSGGGPATFTTSYAPTGSATDPLAVSLVDQAGVVTGIDTALDAAAGSDVEAVPGQPMTLRISWTAGECADRVTMVLNSVSAGYELTIHNHEGITAISCTAAGISRALNVAFSQDVAPEQLSLNVQYP
jgi:hypothetical protein